MQRTIVRTSAAPAAIGPYSQAVKIGSLVYTSGQIPINPATGHIEASDIAGQTEQVMKNLEAVLNAAGSGFDRVVKSIIFLKDLEHFGTVNEIYGRCFPKDPPARSCVQVARLPKDVLIEIEAIAAI